MAKIKPAKRLKEMQNNEKLVAVNERIEEAQNYRNELKKFEVLEAERVEKMKQENADYQRRTLLASQVSLQPSNFVEKRHGHARIEDRNWPRQPQNQNGQGLGGTHKVN